MNVHIQSGIRVDTNQAKGITSCFSFTAKRIITLDLSWARVGATLGLLSIFNTVGNPRHELKYLPTR